MKYILLCSIILLAACSVNNKTAVAEPDFNLLAEKYVRLGLTIGQYDADFVDAYYGPDSLKPATTKMEIFPKDSLLAQVFTLKNELKTFISDTTANDTLQQRALWMNDQLTAFARRIRIFSKEFESFDLESKELFGVVAPTYPESHFKNLISGLDSLLPGSGSIAERFQILSQKFKLPPGSIDTVFKTAIKEAKKRTLANYTLPEGEGFSLEYVQGKSWSGYNWYKGNYQSLIQISNDVDIFAERAIDLACHEGYPGHHVYNMLLEKNLFREKGWVEISLYPLFSPQSLIAEGSANYGIEMAFPGNAQSDYVINTLLPLAKVDTAGAAFYFKALEIKGRLNYARNEVARGIINGRMNEPEALRWLKEYGLYSDETAGKSLSFMKKYRSYVINYNYGQDIIKEYINRQTGTGENTEKRWQHFYHLLSNPVTISQLIKQ